MITIEVRDQQVRAALSALAARVGNPRPFLQAIGDDIMERTKQRFETSTGPDGRRWQPNARAAIESFIAKRGGFGKRGINEKGQGLAIGKKPLIATGELRRQFHVNATNDAVTISNSVRRYAAIQQFGGQAGKGRKVTIPARPFLPVTAAGNIYPQDKALILEQLNDWLAGRA
jgi:phage virion morphogenesis protein